jgi:hypothetical protein
MITTEVLIKYLAYCTSVTIALGVLYYFIGLVDDDE